MKKYRAILSLAMILAVMVLMVGCVHVNINDTSGSDSGKQSEEQSAPNSEDVQDSVDDVMKAVVPPEDFDPVGEYQDETSQRAMMTITPEGEEGHYVVNIDWGSSAWETTIWEFEGDFDRDAGMLSYKKCTKYELYLDENDKQQEKVIYDDGTGALMYYEDGFHWEDKKENAGKDCHFIKTDDLSDTIIEEAEDE